MIYGIKTNLLVADVYDVNVNIKKTLTNSKYRAYTSFQGQLAASANLTLVAVHEYQMICGIIYCSVTVCCAFTSAKIVPLSMPCHFGMSKVDTSHSLSMRSAYAQAPENVYNPSRLSFGSFDPNSSQMNPHEFQWWYHNTMDPIGSNITQYGRTGAHWVAV